VILAFGTWPPSSAFHPALAENLIRLMIRSSLTTQEQASVAARGKGSAAVRW